MGSKQSKIIVAIDFGTTYSGFSYLFSTDPNNIITASHGSILPDDRVPTVLLLNRDNSLHSFGIDAEDNYAKFMLAGTHSQYRLFREFKMALYTKNERLDKNMRINDTENRSMKAMTVFSIVIKHIKELVLKSVKQSKLSSTDSFQNIIWMLTIPAIWSDSARQFMREAANEAGIDNNRLRLILEPEAAALFCKDQLLCANSNAELTRLTSIYMLADLGGGTVDICVHKVLPSGNIRELHRASGGDFGGIKVNSEFMQFLIKLFGSNVMKMFRKSHYYDYLLLTRGFETEKNTFDIRKPSFVIHIPSTLIEMVKNDSECNIETLLNQSEYSSLVELRDHNKLCCNRELMEKFFKSSLDGIITILHEIKSSCWRDEIDVLLVVGGFAESQYLRESIAMKVQFKNIVLAQEPRLAVLKGAVKMGLHSNYITQRRARYTYGFRVAEPFIQDKHPEFLKFKREGKYFCDRIFSKVIEKEMNLKVGQRFKVNVHENIPHSTNMDLSIALYRSSEPNPSYCLESKDKCTKVGTIIIEAPESGWPNYYNIDQILIAEETELKVLAFDKTTGRKLRTKVDFL